MEVTPIPTPPVENADVDTSPASTDMITAADELELADKQESGLEVETTP